MTSDPLIGRTLGAYRVELRLGAGGIGAVYRASHVRTGRRYAVKVLLQEAAVDGPAAARFQREAEALAALGHAGIVAIHDFDVADKTPFLVMDLLTGEDLAGRIDREGALAWDVAQRVFEDIASALEAAHREGILHRDLKPANVFLAKREGAPERAVLLDFGLAKMVEESTEAQSKLTATGAAMGTPLYMSPEQARAEPVDERADVYSLACILFEMLTGTPPFTGPTLTAILSRVLTEPPPKLSHRAPHITDRLDGLIEKALAKEPEDRWASVAELRAALALAASGWSVAPPPQGAARPLPVTRETPAAPRRPAGATALVATTPSAMTPSALTPDTETSLPAAAAAAASTPMAAVVTKPAAPPTRAKAGFAAALVAVAALAGGGAWLARGTVDEGDRAAVAEPATPDEPDEPIVAEPAPAVEPVAAADDGGPEADARAALALAPPPAPPEVSAPPRRRRARTSRRSNRPSTAPVESAPTAEAPAAEAPVAEAPVAPAGYDPEAVRAAYAGARRQQQAAIDNANRQIAEIEPFLTVVAAMRSQSSGSREPAFCASPIGDLDVAARGDNSLLGSVARNLRDRARSLCDIYAAWDEPPENVLSIIARTTSELDRAQARIEGGRPGDETTPELRAELLDAVQRTRDAVRASAGGRFPCRHPVFSELRVLSDSAGSGGGRGADQLRRHRDRVCNGIGVSRLSSYRRTLAGAIDQSESSIRSNVRAQRDMIRQLQAAMASYPAPQ